MSARFTQGMTFPPERDEMDECLEVFIELEKERDKSTYMERVKKAVDVVRARWENERGFDVCKLWM